MRQWVISAASAAVLLAGLVAGCGSVETTENPTAGSGGAGAGSSGNGGTGAGGNGATCTVTPTTGLVLAIDSVLLGETNPDGTPNAADGWKQYGFNVDGMVSDGTAQNLCQPQGSAPPIVVHTDGDDGIDNAFGKNVLPLLLSVKPEGSAAATEAIQQGEPSVLLYLEGLGTAPTQNQIPARVYTGARTVTRPAFEGSDCWPVDPVSLQSAGEIAATKVSFEQSLVVSDSWSTGAVSPGPLTVRLQLGGAPLVLTLRQVLMRFDFADGRARGVAGHLGGVLDAEELAQAVGDWASAVQPELCEGDALEAFLVQVRQAADILGDGTQDAGETCDGISIGLGFTMAKVALGSIAPPTQATESCAP